jgi:PEGA domain
VSGTANTDTHCQTTFTPPTETSLTHYDRVNYTIAQSSRALYLLACTQHWMLTKKERTFLIIGALTAGSEGVKKNAKGTWTECPAFTIGAKFALSVGSTSDAHLEGAPGGNPVKLDYLSSAALPPAPSAPQQPQAASTPGVAKVHVTSSPSGGEIYVDGKFFGNTPSDISLPLGEHVVKVTFGGKEWTRTVQITGGEIQLRAEIP